MPADKPRYLMGVGTPEDLVEAVAAGVDMFDCVMPTRNARNGHLFVPLGRHEHPQRALRRRHRSRRPGLRLLYLPATISRAYLRHLDRCGEMLGPRLATLHNLHHYLALMSRMREAIAAGRFVAFRAAFHAALRDGAAEAAP